MTILAGVYTYELAVLPRWEAEVPIAREDRVQYFPVRTICKILGIDSPTQISSLRANPRYDDALRDIPIRGKAGFRPTTCIRRKELGLWIAGIDPLRCKITTRGPLREFQEDLLAEADRLLFGQAPRLRGDRRATFTATQRLEVRMACLECGAQHILLITDGKPEEIRLLTDDDTLWDDDDD